MGYQTAQNEQSNEKGLSTVVIPDVSIGSVRSDGRLTRKEVRSPQVTPFVYFFSPGAFQPMDGEMLPRLFEAKLLPGVNRVVKVDGRVIPTQMIQWHIEEGRTIVPPDIDTTAFGERVTGYVRAHKHVNGRMHHTSVWERWKLVGGQMKKERDKEGYRAFLRQIKELYTGDPSSTVVQESLASIKGELQHLAQRPSTDMVAKARAAVLRAYHPSLENYLHGDPSPAVEKLKEAKAETESLKGLVQKQLEANKELVAQLAAMKAEAEVPQNDEPSAEEVPPTKPKRSRARKK